MHGYLFLYFFIILIIFYVYSYLFLYIYIPSFQHFKALLTAKFNPETSFLYQLFEGNSNIILLKPCKLINEAIFGFSLLFIFIHIYIYAFIQLHIHILKPSRCLNSILRQVFCINFSRRIQIS